LEKSNTQIEVGVFKDSDLTVADSQFYVFV